MLDLFLAYAPIARPVALMLLPGLLAWLAWRLFHPTVGAAFPSTPLRARPALEPASSRAKACPERSRRARSYPNP